MPQGPTHAPRPSAISRRTAQARVERGARLRIGARFEIQKAENSPRQVEQVAAESAQARDARPVQHESIFDGGAYARGAARVATVAPRRVAH